ncbi:MAG: SRPBCC family protein [Ferruginibacter sp.]
MDKSFIEKQIEINTTPKILWRAFTDPLVTRQMGGEYITDWKVGSSLNWKGMDGNIYTNGIILELDPEKVFKHNLFNVDENTKILSVITYKLHDNNGSTTLYAREDYGIEMTDKEYEEASEGWSFALNILRETAESL